MKHIFTKSFALIVAGMMMSATSLAQISINGETYTQNFNAIGGSEVTPTPYTEGSDSKTAVAQASTLPTGWKVETQTSVRTIGTYAAASSATTYIGGTSVTAKDKNGTWNFGETGSTDRAVGGITTNVTGGARTINLMAHLHNDAGVDIKSLAVSYDIEKYRKGTLAAGFAIQLYTSADGVTWKSACGDFYTMYSADSETIGDENVPLDTKNVSSSLNVWLPADGDLYLLWSISSASDDNANNAQAFGIDNVSITPSTEPTGAVVITDDSTISENFNSLGGSTITQTQIDGSGKGSYEQASTLPTGWKIEANTTNPRVLGSYSSALSTTMYIGGTSLADKAKNGTWNFGVTESVDRAVGGLTTSAVTPGTRGINVMARLYNDSPENIESITLSYDIKKFRNCNNTSNFVVQLYTSATGEEGSWESAGEAFRTIFTDNGNVSPVDPTENTVNVSNSLEVNFPVGRELYLAWNISVASGTTCSGAPALAIDNVSLTPGASAVEPVTPVASNEMFATYQKQGDRFYQTGGEEATTTESYNDWAVNYYIVSCGDSILLRATTTESNNLNDGWQTQLRIWTTTKNNDNEVQVNAGDTKNRYTSKCIGIKPSAEEVKMHFFLNWEDYSVTETFNFNRASINNPIEDNVAPSINPEDVTMTEVDGKLVFTFGDVTASEPYFYYVADKDHNLGGISLTNKVYITKPTVEDGTTYRFKCYAVDYNGNKSDYKEFTLEMPFDNSLDLAYQKKCTAGYSNGGDTPDKAVNGLSGGADDHWGTYGISDYSLNWWMVDLNNPYDLSEIDINFATPGKYKIEGSLDAEHWTEILSVNETPAADTKIEHTGLTASARYLKVTCLVNEMIAIRHFNVYATGIAAPDATNPTVSVSCTAKTVNSATLKIIATDEDDAGDPGIITSINISGDHGFVTQNNVTLNGEDEITLSDLDYNITYNFTVTVIDKAGNTASTNIEVVLPFNTELDLALEKSCIAGYSYDTDTPNKAVNGAEDHWGSYQISDYSQNWWRVDLGNTYDLSEIDITFATTNTYRLEVSYDDVNWYTILDNQPAASPVAHTGLKVAAKYIRLTALGNNMVAIKHFKVYGTAFSTADATNPTVDVTCTDKTIHTATLKIDAADLDDAGDPGAISYINISGDNEFVAQNNVALDGNNEITLTGLTDNTTYHFTVTVLDRRFNQTSANIEVKLPLNPNYNLAKGKTAVAGAVQGDYTANKGCDGKEETMWSSYTGNDRSKDWWYVDLGEIYKIRQVNIKWMNDNAVRFLIQGVNTLPEEENIANDNYWTTYLDYTYASDPGTDLQSHVVVGKMRYLRLKALQTADINGINFYELEVYGSDYATEDNVAPVIGTAECTTDTENSSVTFTLTATDAVDGAIKDFYISSADPVVTEAKYTTNNDNQLTIDGLDNTKDYTFLVRCRDLSGNWTETNVVAHFAMALGTNVAEGKNAVAGSTEGDYLAEYAVDGNNTDNHRWGNYGQVEEGNNWWRVDLVNAYLLSNIAITWQTAPDGGCVIEGSQDGVSYTQITTYNGTEYNTRVRQVLEITGEQVTIPYRYIRVRANDQTNFMSFFEFEVYASEEMRIVSFADNADDNTTTIDNYNGDEVLVTLNRTIAADNTWYTICLPFDMDADKVAEVFGESTIAKLNNTEERGSLLHLNFDYVNAIEAGKPYLIKVGNTFTAGSTISGVTIQNGTPEETGDDNIKFVGTYNQKVLNQANQRFVADDDYLYSPADGGTTMGAFRCYFYLPDGSSALAPGKRAKIVFGPQQTTDIDQTSQEPKANSQKLLLNGQLYIIHDGKTYNAQGMLIK